jgi:hypothetical protein
MSCMLGAHSRGLGPMIDYKRVGHRTLRKKKSLLVSVNHSWSQRGNRWTQLERQLHHGTRYTIYRIHKR